MLNSNEHGFMVMNKELTSYSLSDISLETCKRYCRNGDVITKQTPYIAGCGIRFVWYKWEKYIEFKRKLRHANIFWLHIWWHREYLHKTGEIVYRSQ